MEFSSPGTLQYPSCTGEFSFVLYKHLKFATYPDHFALIIFEVYTIYSSCFLKNSVGTYTLTPSDVMSERKNILTLLWNQINRQTLHMQDTASRPILWLLLPDWSVCCSYNHWASIRTYRDELSYLAPLGSENISTPYFKQCFFRGGYYPPQTESNTTPLSPKTEITNILFYILNFASIIKFKM